MTVPAMYNIVLILSLLLWSPTVSCETALHGGSGLSMKRQRQHHQHKLQHQYQEGTHQTKRTNHGPRQIKRANVDNEQVFNLNTMNVSRTEDTATFKTHLLKHTGEDVHFVPYNAAVYGHINNRYPSYLPAVESSSSSSEEQSEIQFWYEKGLRECEEYYSQNAHRLRTMQVQKGMPYPETTAPRPQCRGEALLLQASGNALTVQHCLYSQVSYLTPSSFSLLCVSSCVRCDVM